MKEKELRIFFTEYNGSNELSDKEQILIDEAKKAAKKAYAPYSHFKVGAAILLDDGTIVKGANVENAAFPSGSCAERTALSYSVANYSDKRPVAIAITAYSAGKLTSEPVPPCGNCRQMLLEEEHRHDKPIKVILIGAKKVIVVKNCQSLLPLHFTENNLHSKP